MSDSLTIYHNVHTNADTRLPDPHQDTFSKTVLGFWMYLMSDCLLFGSLFATYAVLHQETFGGPSSRELFQLPTAFAETMILLFSSVACGFGLLSAVKNQKKAMFGWLLVTFVLGVSFVAMEVIEFRHLLEEGHSFTKSAFLSAFFTLVGTHGLHVSVGLFWLVVMLLQLSFQGITVDTFRRLVVFSLFWHFLDLVWIFIFTFVYLMGVL